jgi:hypothetical protein
MVAEKRFAEHERPVDIQRAHTLGFTSSVVDSSKWFRLGTTGLMNRMRAVPRLEAAAKPPAYSPPLIFASAFLFDYLPLLLLFADFQVTFNV